MFSGNPNGGEIRSVDYVDEQVAWILTLTTLYKTEDGGRTWIEQPKPIPGYPLGEMTGVKFLKGGQMGWAAGGLFRQATRKEQLIGAPTNIYNAQTKMILTPVIFQTNDHGKTWVRQSLPDIWGRAYVPTFLNERQGIAFGGSGVFYTGNGGKRWKDVDFKKSCTDERYQEAYDARPLQVFFLDFRNVWLTFDDGRMTKSIDGGQSWCDLVAAGAINFDYYDAYFRKIYFANVSHGWGLGANGFLYETKDGGKTWTKVSNTHFDDMFFLDNETGWLISKLGMFRISS